MEQWEIEWKDYYGILGLGPDATSDEIREAFRALAAALHPDRYRTARGRQWKTKSFQRLQEAYEYLSDPGKRAKYDHEYTQRVGSKTAGEQKPTSTAQKQGESILAILPEDIDLGAIQAGTQAVAAFTIVNEGGPPKPGARLRVAPREPWLRILEPRYTFLSPPQPFPVYLEVPFDTTGLEPDRSYDGFIEVWLEEES